MVGVLFVSAAVVCVLTFLLALYATLKHEKLGRRLPAIGLVLTIALMTYYLAARSSQLGHFPAFCWRDLLVTFSWAFGLVLVVTIFRRGKPIIMAGGMLPPALCMTIAAFVAPREVQTEPFFFHTHLDVHIVVSFVGYAALWLAFLTGLLYFILERGLKSKKVEGYVKILPPLEELDRFFYRASGFGFIFLTLGVMSGILFLRQLTGRWWSWDLKVVLTLVTWLTYALLLHQRAFIGWRGKRIMLLSILGLLLVVGTFVGVNLFAPGHGGSLLGN